VPKVNKVMLLKNKGDFLMHGVVLQFSCFPGPRPVKHPMFHVKPFSPAPLTQNPRRDVSRETFLRKSPAKPPCVLRQAQHEDRLFWQYVHPSS